MGDGLAEIIARRGALGGLTEARPSRDSARNLQDGSEPRQGAFRSTVRAADL